MRLTALCKPPPPRMLVNIVAAGIVAAEASAMHRSEVSHA
ncbi:Uncharacterized protein ChrSV_0063 [Chromobacterium vaccinii]|nr:Uncharacterized protein ChrSW_0063 [Chromobacterium vaccinii]QND87522.1 Uncharacterized protein ChrSV_0063 [Chromobacterium vaccinii]